MGVWGDGLFDDDLAADIRAHFDDAVEEGASPADASRGLLDTELAQEILEEKSDEDYFFEENRGLFYAVASLQLDHGALTSDAKRWALRAIEVERPHLDAASDGRRIEVLAKLEAALRATTAA